MRRVYYIYIYIYAHTTAFYSLVSTNKWSCERMGPCKHPIIIKRQVQLRREREREREVEREREEGIERGGGEGEREK